MPACRHDGRVVGLGNNLGVVVLAPCSPEHPPGATSPAELAALCARDDRLGSLYRSLRELPEEYAEDIRGGVPKLARRSRGGSRGVSGYSLAIVEHRPLVGLSTCPRGSVSDDCFSAIGRSFPVGSIMSDQRHFSDPNEILEGPTRSWGLPSWRPSVLISTLPL